MSSERPLTWTPPQLPRALRAMLARLAFDATEASPFEVRSWLVSAKSCDSRDAESASTDTTRGAASASPAGTRTRRTKRPSRRVAVAGPAAFLAGWSSTVGEEPGQLGGDFETEVE